MFRCFRHSRELVEEFKENKDRGNLYLRWCLADYYCIEAIMTNNNSLILHRWQDIREKYRKAIVAKNPEFFKNT